MEYKDTEYAVVVREHRQVGMHIVVASSSPYRQATYREALVKLGHRVETVGNGIECLERMRVEKPDLLVLEAPLPWGGSDGVLEVSEQDFGTRSVPVIVVAVGSGSIDWFQLSRFKIDDFLFRVPTVQELGDAIDSVLGLTANMHGPTSHPRHQRDRRMNDAVNPSPSTWEQSGVEASLAVYQH